MADMNQESIQQKIQVARRDAEALKDRIKRKKDELADTTRTSLACRCDAVQCRRRCSVMAHCAALPCPALHCTAPHRTTPHRTSPLC